MPRGKAWTDAQKQERKARNIARRMEEAAAAAAKEENAPAAPTPAPDDPAPATAAAPAESKKPLPPSRDSTSTDAAAMSDSKLEAQVEKLQKDCEDYHNRIADLDDVKDRLENELKEVRADLHRCRQEADKVTVERNESNAKADNAEALVGTKEEEKSRVSEQLTKEKAKAQQLQTFVETLNAEVEDKEDQIKKLGDQVNDGEARLRAAEADVIALNEQLTTAQAAREMLDVVNEKLGGHFEDMGKDLTPEALIQHIDDLEEAHLPRPRSGHSLHSDFVKATAHAKSGVRKISVSDELEKASESMEDDDEEAEKLQEYTEELERQLAKMLEEKQELQSKLDAMEEEKAEDRKDSRATSATEPAKPEMNGIEKEPETKTIHEVQTITVEKPVSRPFTFMDLLRQAPWLLYVLLAVCLIISGINYYQTYSERMLWLDANRQPWRTGDIYHGYVARRQKFSKPSFTFRPGPIIHWIERDLLGYLDSLPG